MAAHSRNVYFNPRSREGSDTQDVAKSAHNTDFNPRSREGSDKITPLFNVILAANFNPRSREGSDDSANQNSDTTIIISIHAPARGATRASGTLTAGCMISIHAPARGATIRSTKISMHKKFQSTLPRGERRLGGSGCPVDRYHFNPRSREGSDSFFPPPKCWQSISIHAPARGATRVML